MLFFPDSEPMTSTAINSPAEVLETQLDPEPSSPPRKVLKEAHHSCRSVSYLYSEALRLGTEPAFVPAEALALELHNKPRIEHSDILELWSLIPLCKRLKPPRAQIPGQSHLVFGLSSRMPEQFTTPSFSLKHTVRALALFVLQHFPELRFTTMTLATNQNKGPHRDLNNAEAPAFLTCLTQQSGGDLWIHDTSGQHPMSHLGQTLFGSIIGIKQRPSFFFSRSQIHCWYTLEKWIPNYPSQHLQRSTPGTPSTPYRTTARESFGIPCSYRRGP